MPYSMLVKCANCSDLSLWRKKHLKMFTLDVFILMLICSAFGQAKKHPHDYGFDLADVLGLEKNYDSRPKQQPSLQNSASKFLLEVYKDISGNDADLDHVREHLAHSARQRRALKEENFITDFDRKEIKNCNNIITFLSKKLLNVDKTQPVHDTSIISDMQMGFNTIGVPKDLQLVHSALRIYQNPGLGKYENEDSQSATITIYGRKMNHGELTGDLRIHASINTTTTYKGWLEFNMTRVLNRWLQQKSNKFDRINALIVGVKLNLVNAGREGKTVDILPSELGLISTDLAAELIDLQPFVIGYFNGPKWITKIRKLRFKRDVAINKSDVVVPHKPLSLEVFKVPKTCERLNFTLNFEDLEMHKWIIAPKKFEAYFCSGECDFPLASRMNATNHAIVQTLMHVQKSRVPKPSCVPTALDAISILHYLSEDSVNLSKYPQSVAKACGCH